MPVCVTDRVCYCLCVQSECVVCVVVCVDVCMLWLFVCGWSWPGVDVTLVVFVLRVCGGRV